MVRNRTVQSQEELDDKTDEFVQSGYKIATTFERGVLLKEKNLGSLLGHLVVAVLTLWWTFGVGNVLYAVYKSFTADMVHVQVEGE